MRRTWPLAALLTAVLVVGSGGLVAEARAETCDGVWVVTDPGPLGGSATLNCAPGDPSSGIGALRAAGHTAAYLPTVPGFVCTIDARPDPCNGAPPHAYWSYWWAPAGGSWTYAVVGAGQRDPAPGEVEGWVFGDGSAPPAVAPPAAPAPPPEPAPDPPAADPTPDTDPDPAPGSDASPQDEPDRHTPDPTPPADAGPDGSQDAPDPASDARDDEPRGTGTTETGAREPADAPDAPSRTGASDPGDLDDRAAGRADDRVAAGATPAAAERAAGPPTALIVGLGLLLLTLGATRWRARRAVR